MPSKTKKVLKTAKASAGEMADKAKSAANRSMKKVQAAGSNGVEVDKTKAVTAAKTVTAKAKTPKKKAVGFIQNVKDHLHSGMEAVGDFVKKITPDALLPDSAKSEGTAKSGGK